MICYIYFHFSFATSKKKKKHPEKQPLLYMPSFASSFGVIQLGKQIRNMPLFVFWLANIRKHKWDLYPPDVFWYLCLLYKTLTKTKKHSCDPCFHLLRSETVIKKTEKHADSKAKKKKKTGGASIAVVTAPKHPLEKLCDINFELIAAGDAYWYKN